ncbi:Sulfate transport system permease protein CysW [Serratia liquefaciens]|jgi:iron(III) transport system permease protein|uniref:ABC transporter permease n=1 Tax=Serratia liquefaciens TaxID=614 RepID=UPI0021779982|nr:iron ABC transporter permease [Serratia liquefaciens]CAI0885146.1 Sulfate transport system permease protein CysW [Serratia liquefaciens]CAI0936511.1 Sulfate transport system permease protein CysW [Serratia liquefaciens]CAI0946212.1 Sulfate transport system permease protein CysW [Serratia liquefaciens]
MNAQNRRLDGALVLGALALLLLPWYSQEAGFFDFGWLTTLWQDQASAPALWQILTFQRPWLAIALLMLLVCALARLLKIGRFRSQLLIAASLVGVVFLLFEGHAIGYSGWNWQWSEHLFGALSDGQPAFGAGAILLITTFLLLFSFALAERGVLKGDAFVVAAIVLLVALVTTFVLYPVLSMFVASVQDVDGSFKPDGLIANMQDPAIWSLSCLKGSSCGTAWRTLTLALMTASGSTLLGLAFALAATRTPLPFKKGLRMLTVLPIITPPFVIGLALMLLFGRAGVVTELLAGVFGIEPGRWLYGLTGIWIAQVLSFTPIAFLVLIGVVEGVSPSLEEASQTLRANRWRTFRYVSLPLMAPGLANAFLISFIESMADFGNPMVLGGSHGVLSTEIFFSVVGAQNDPSRAAVLAIILLCFTLSAFILQRLWLAGKSFATVTGKGDSGTHCGLPRGLRYGVYALVIPWGLFTLVIYGMILIGGFVQSWGLDSSLTLGHYARAFGFHWNSGQIVWTGVAWNSFWTTLEIALIAAPLTAIVGLLTAWLIVRQKFAGRQTFEFMLMLSFAIPGTVIGVSYIMAYNLPPLEITGTALILVACFVFRNMPVGVRGGIAAMSQLDRSLDEASLTLRASSFRTLRKVILPLLKPAISAALVYAFVRAITSISAVIFLVSAQYNMATSYIVGLVENGEYGVAIAYSSVLIVVMLAVILTFQLLVGERRLRRAIRITTPPVTPPPALHQENAV